MIIQWITGDNFLLVAEAVFWLCIIMLSPVIYKTFYYATAPIWAWLLPAKTVELRYVIKGTVYTSTVDANSNLSQASSHLRTIAEQKHRKQYDQKA